MREIKFRGKRVNDGEWVYGYLTKNRPSPKNAEPPYELQSAIDHEEKGVMLASLVDPETVGQFTGLADKNGKEIYEGDICSTYLSRPYLIVVFRNGAFMYQCHDDGKDYFDIMLPIEVESEVDKYTEVVGNIHDNPSLLVGDNP